MHEKTAASKPLLKTARLSLRKIVDTDAGFVVDLLNDPDFLNYIGDRGVRNEVDAVAYIHNGPTRSYRQHGYGMNVVERSSDGKSMGMCGLVRRDWLDTADLGFAFLPEFRRQGYAWEAAVAVVEYAFDDLDLTRLLAIASPGNDASITLLDKLGMTLAGAVQAPGDDTELGLYELHRTAIG